jgi:hypothetical protein
LNLEDGATKVRTDTDDHQISGLIERVSFWRRPAAALFRTSGQRQHRPTWQRIQHVLGAIDDPHRLAAPLDGHHLTWLELADIDFDRSACCLGAFGRKQAGDERHKRGDRTSTAHGCGRNDQTPPSAVHFSLIAHYADP